MFKVKIKIANAWVDGSKPVSRANARRLAKLYRLHSHNVTQTRVTRVEGN